MIEHGAIFTVSMVILISLLTMLSNRIRVAYPILLVLAGLALSYMPGMPHIEIEPELVFVIFLPPLLYEAAFANSWKELWKWRRIIMSFSFIVVFITATVVALVANALLPGFSIALGFLLGGIVSPPDAVSASAIMKFVKVPRRVSTILEGESLFNDASSLIIVQFALIVIGTGQFVWHEAAITFLWMIVGGAGAGLLLAILFVFLHQKLPTDHNIDIVFTLIAPYVMYIGAEAIGASGVLAVVSGGLYMSEKNLHYMDSTSRLGGINVWHNISYLLNGFVFLLIGLDLPEIRETLQADGIGLGQATLYGLAVSAVLILLRIAVAYGAVYVTQFMSHFIEVADTRHPGKGTPLLLGWTGMRGVVSLAAALGIPLLLHGEPFPQRSMILYITFIVILTTLLLQGLTLPLLISRIHFPDYGDHLPTEEAERIIANGLANRKDTDFHTRRLWLWQLNKENPKIDEELILRHIHRLDLEEELTKC